MDGRRVGKPTSRELAEMLVGSEFERAYQRSKLLAMRLICCRVGQSIVAAEADPKRWRLDCHEISNRNADRTLGLSSCSIKFERNESQLAPG
jgi:hypothetical protein